MAKSRKPPNYPGVTKQLRRIPISQIPPVLFNGPPNSAQIRIQCGCGHCYAPPWSERLQFEYAPFQSADGANWVLAGKQLPCPACGKQNDFPFPTSGILAGNVNLFGDEAATWIGAGFLYIYAFVAVHADHLQSVRAAIHSAKLAIRPSIEPERWTWHTWEIRDSRWRLQHGVTLSIREIDAQLRHLASSIGRERDGRFVSVTVFPPFDLRGMKHKLAETTVRDKALTGAVVGITEFLTRQGFTPHFTVEAQTLDHQRGQIDSFVERIGRGLRHDLGYHYICRGKMVGLPTTAPKGSSLEMEIADFVAYFVRRFFYLGQSEEACEVPPSLLGDVLWGVFTPHRFGTRMAAGFPMHYFFPDLAARAQSGTSA